MIELLTVQEVAALLKTNRQQVRKLIREQLLPSVKIGREYRIPAEYLEAFLQNNLE